MSSPNESRSKSSRVRGEATEQMMRQLAFKWRRDPAILRVDKPTRLGRARKLGYRDKQGYVVVRARVRRSGARKVRPVSGRRPKGMGVTKVKWAKSYTRIAEERVARKYPNMEVLNSYYLWSDGMYFWAEVLVVDPSHPAVSIFPKTKWI